MKNVKPKEQTNKKNLLENKSKELFSPDLKNSNPHSVQFYQEAYGNLATLRHFSKDTTIQTKLKINQPGDEYEKEADKVAEQVFEKTTDNEKNNKIENANLKKTSIPTPPLIQRRTNSSNQAPDLLSIEHSSNNIENQLGKQSESGVPLSSDIRDNLEPQLETNFKDVRIHTGGEAAKLNRSFNARAFTYGNHVFFGNNEYSPDTLDGQKLITHELTHVVQQNNNHLMPKIIQRDPRDAGIPAGVPMPETTDEPEPILPEFEQEYFYEPGERFDSEYIPGEPAPYVGQLNVLLYVHITFAPFTRAMMRSPAFRGHRFTPEQMRDFAWTAEEEETFQNDFIQSVHDAWSEQHGFCLDESDFAAYSCRVNVEVLPVADEESAHNRITAQKVPEGAPRLRSFVQGNESTLDIRDPSEPETVSGHAARIVRQIGPFGYDSAELTPGIISQINALEALLRPLQEEGPPECLLSTDWAVDYVGRASSPGGPVYNEQLGLRRAQAVENQINSDMNRASALSRAGSRGDVNASDDPVFQRVDIAVWNVPEAFQEPEITFTQNTAAHEAGHMFGLGDEYVRETDLMEGEIPKFQGQRPTHYDDVAGLMGEDTANEMLIQNSGSMMSQGSEVHRGHYVYFLDALINMTGRNWEIE